MTTIGLITLAFLFVGVFLLGMVVEIGLEIYFNRRGKRNVL